MRKFLMLATIFACMFAFASCKDEENEDELKSVQYTLEAYFADYTNIYVYEYSEKGDKLKTNTLYSLKRNETKTYTSERGCKKVHVYAKCGEDYIAEKNDYVLEDVTNKILLNPASVITEEEYNFYTK